MASLNDSSALAEESVDELQEVLAGPSKQQRPKYRLWLGPALGVTCLMAVGLIGVKQALEPPSALARISVAHHTINSIIAAAVAKGSFNTKVEFLLDEYSELGSPPSAMGIYAGMAVAGDYKWPRVLVTLAATTGNGAALEKKVNDIVDAIYQLAVPPREVEHIKSLVTVSQDGDSVSVEVKAPDDRKWTEEDQELKAAFQAHKPEFKGNISFGRTFQDMYELKSKSVALLPHGFEIKLDSTFASTIVEVVKKLPNHVCPPRAVHMLELVRMWKLREELFYTSEDEVAAAMPSLPTLQDAFDGVCGMFPGVLSDALDGLDDVLQEVKQAVLEGLPYDWELVANFSNVNPSTFLTHCVTAA